MTARMVLASMAMAALALMLSGVVAAHAAVENCSVYPERCQYGANGVYYFYPNGYRVPGSTAAPRSGAAWGCAATDGRVRSGSWGYPNRLAASESALSRCAMRGTSCRILICRPSIRNSDEAHAIFHR
jgi:hypothetical protein